MKAEILCVGTELLLGDCVNTNAAYISSQLKNLGIDVYYQTVVGDNPDRLSETLKNSFLRSEIVILTGGLGPTYDDLTKETIANYFGLELKEDKDILEKIGKYFINSNTDMPKNNKKQALIPEGAKILNNTTGTAPGIIVSKHGKHAVLLPGPPKEMQPMFEKEVIPFLTGFSEKVFISKKINICGVGESTVEEMLSDIMKNSINPTVAPYVSEGEMYIRVAAGAQTEKEAEELINPVVQNIIDILGKYVYAIDGVNLQTHCVNLLKRSNTKIATAESCTGGLLSKKITEIPGSSEIFELGVCTYSNKAKEKILKVNPETLKKFGAVSKETAMEMASGIRYISGADIGVSITGIAGPGGTDDKEIGLVYIGICTKDKCVAREFHLGGRLRDRESIRLYSAVNALSLIISELKN